MKLGSGLGRAVVGPSLQGLPGPEAEAHAQGLKRLAPAGLGLRIPHASVSLFVKPKWRGLDGSPTAPRGHVLCVADFHHPKADARRQNHGDPSHPGHTDLLGAKLVSCRGHRSPCVLWEEAQMQGGLCSLGCHTEPFREPHGPAWSLPPEAE